MPDQFPVEAQSRIWAGPSLSLFAASFCENLCNQTDGRRPHLKKTQRGHRRVPRHIQAIHVVVLGLWLAQSRSQKLCAAAHSLDMLVFVDTAGPTTLVAQIYVSQLIVKEFELHYRLTNAMRRKTKGRIIPNLRALGRPLFLHPAAPTYVPELEVADPLVVAILANPTIIRERM